MVTGPASGTLHLGQLHLPLADRIEVAARPLAGTAWRHVKPEPVGPTARTGANPDRGSAPLPASWPPHPGCRAATGC